MPYWLRVDQSPKKQSKKGVDRHPDRSLNSLCGGPTQPKPNGFKINQASLDFQDHKDDEPEKEPEQKKNEQESSGRRRRWRQAVIYGTFMSWQLVDNA